MENRTESSVGNSRRKFQLFGGDQHYLAALRLRRFFELSRKALETAAEVVSLETASYIQLRDRSGQMEQLQNRFEQQVSTLRNLLD